MKKLIALTTMGAAALAVTACDVEQTEEGEMPNVEVEGGNMPEYDVDTPEVEVRTEERTVDVPVVETEPADASEN